METPVESKIAVKLFVGCLLNAESKMHLQNSISWKQMQIDKENHTENFKQIHYQNHEYFGLFAEQERITLQDLKSIEALIRKAFEDFCPKLNKNTLKVVVFPQILLS